jgi:hypothetical protein
MLPAHLRARYAEQWAADARDADELGLSSREIVRGAWRFALLARVGAHGADAIELDRQSWRLARWAGALIGTAALGSTVGYVTIGGAVIVDDPGVPPLLSLLTIAPVVLAVASAVAGVALLVASVLRRPSIRAGSVLVVIALSAGVLLVAGWPVQIAMTGSIDSLALLIGIVLLIIGSISAAVAFETAPRAIRHDGGLPSSRAPRLSSPMIVGIGAAGIVVATVLGAVEGLVWGPLNQTAQALTLDQVYAILGPRESRMGVVMVAVWAAGSLVLAIALPAIRWWMLRAHRPETAIAHFLLPFALLAIGAVVVGQGWATFGIGMSIADSIPPYAGSRSIMWSVYVSLGATLGLLGVLLALAPSRTAPPNAHPARPAVSTA